jgi:prolyl 4-hydroxylase
MGSEEYGENTGNSACTYNEAKFAQGKNKTVILIRMIPFEEQFKHLQARVMFGLNKLEVPWMLGTPMPTELPDMLMEAMGLPLSPAPKSPSTPVHANQDWPDELAELMAVPEVVACFAKLDVHNMSDIADVIDAEEGHDKLLMAVVEALPTKPRKNKLLRNRTINALQNLLQLLAVFIEYDTDEDGFLSRVECMRIPHHKVVAKTGGVVGEAFDAMDQNKDGRVSFEKMFEYCSVVSREEGEPPLDTEAELKAALAAAQREKVVYDEMQAMKLEQAALGAAQREQASQEALVQQRAQIEKQAEELQRQKAEFERKSQAAAMEAQRKQDEAARQLAELSLQQKSKPPMYADIPLEFYQRDGKHQFINKSYPGLQAINKDPWVFVVHDFLSADECEACKAVAMDETWYGSSVAQASGKNLGTEVDEIRRCRSANLTAVHRSTAISAFRKKTVELVGLPDENLEATQITKYSKGDYFKPHGDGIADAYRDLRYGLCQKENANRVVTMFVYLNDVNEGGETRFTDVVPALDVKPVRGTAVLFFPALLPDAPSTPGATAANVMHEGRPVVDEKWILQQWCWSGPYNDQRGR